MVLVSTSRSVDAPDEFTGRVLVAGGVRWKIGYLRDVGDYGDVDPYRVFTYDARALGAQYLQDSEGKRRKIHRVDPDERPRISREVSGDYPDGSWQIDGAPGEWWSSAPGVLEIAGVEGLGGPTMDGYDEFLDAYVACLLWTAYGQTPSGETEDGMGLHELGYGLDDFDADGQKEIEDDAESFFEEAQEMIGDHESQAGHDFCLTRNGHGAGFWDGDWPKSGDELTKMSKPYGTQQAYAELDAEGDIVGLFVHG